MTNADVDKAIKIQGTDYDRKRKITSLMKRRMEAMYARGKSYCYIANYFGVSYFAVRYNLDEDYKKWSNSNRNNYIRNFKQTPEYNAERVDYKRSLMNDKEFMNKLINPNS